MRSSWKAFKPQRIPGALEETKAQASPFGSLSVLWTVSMEPAKDGETTPSPNQQDRTNHMLALNQNPTSENIYWFLLGFREEKFLPLKVTRVTFAS